MRGEARGGPAAEGGPAGTRQTKTVAEDVRLLPAGAREPRHGEVVAERPGDSGHRLQSGDQQARPVPARLYRRPFAAFDRRRARPHAGRSHGRQFGDASIPRSPMPIAPRRWRSARPKAASTWAPAMTAPISRATRAQPRSRRNSARWRQVAGCRDGEARLCELFEGMVAFFAAGRGRAGL